MLVISIRKIFSIFIRLFALHTLDRHIVVFHMIFSSSLLSTSPVEMPGAKRWWTPSRPFGFWGSLGQTQKVLGFIKFLVQSVSAC